MEDKPMPNYFAGKWQRAMQREETRDALNQAEEALPPVRSGFTLPPDSDVTEAAIRVSQPKEQPRLHENYTPDGTYIPLSGGLRGWYENSGVLRSETPNRYRFYEAMNGESFKKTILGRIESFNRRAVVRMTVELWAAYSRAEHEKRHTGYCVDLSVMGARLRTREELQIGEWLTVSLYRTRENVHEGVPLVSANAEVMNFRLANPNQVSPRYYAGLCFHDLEIAAKETLARLAAEGTPLPAQESKLDRTPG